MTHRPNQSLCHYRPADPAAPPAVSIVTPYYNTGPLFLETAESLLGQSLQQWEWIIVNDGSTDPQSLRVLLPFRSADPRIRVIDQQNAGPSAARNTGVAAARAELIFFLDSDNLLAPTALEKLTWFLIGRPQAAFVSSWNVAFGHQQSRSRRGFGSRVIFPYDNTCSSQALIRRAAFEQIGRFDEQRRQGMEDWEFWVRAAASGFWGTDLPEYLIWDRRKPAQAYTSYRWQFRDDPQAIPQLRAELHATYPQVFRDGPPRLPDPTSDPYPIIPNLLPFHNRLAPQGQRRILMLLPSISPGGADRYALDLAAGLIDGGDQVSVCLTRDLAHGWLPDLERITSDVFNLPGFLAPGDTPRFLHYLIESRNITHVFISNSLLAYNLLAYLRSRCPHVAYLDFVHAEQEQRHGGFARVAADHDQLLDLHGVTSRHLGKITAELEADPDRTEICYVGTDDQHWRPDPSARLRIRAELGIPQEQTLILFVARLSAEKRPRLAAQILLALRKAATPFCALIIGDGEDRAFLSLFLRQNRMHPQVRMLGNQPHARVRELMAAADILLLPSQREGIALTLYEAMASGVVPVAAQVGGHAELVLPTCGILIDHGQHEIERYAAALRTLIEQPEQRQTMSRAARIRISQSFSASVGLAHVRTALDRATMLSQKQPRPPVALGVGLASAALSIEHEQLDRRLRRLAPVRLALALRWSSAGRLLTRLAGIRAAVLRLDRRIYSTRRTIGQFIRRICKQYGQ